MERLIEYYIGGRKSYLLPNGTKITEEELNALKQKNFELGYRDRMAGYYDKFYRYNTFDNGESYDKGCQSATKKANCPKECQIIEYKI